LNFELGFRDVRKQSNFPTEIKKEFLRCKGTSSWILTFRFDNTSLDKNIVSLIPIQFLINYTINNNKPMARISGIELPKEKRVQIGLTYIFGVGQSRANKILKNTNVKPDTKVKDLSDDEIKRIQNYIDKNFKVEGELRQIVQDNVKRLKNINSYRGIRHLKGLPVRGQRTRTNTRTVRGNKRVTVGSGRKPPPEPT